LISTTVNNLQVIRSERGYFLGILADGPLRYSLEYWHTAEAAWRSLHARTWTRDPESPASMSGDLDHGPVRD